MRLLRSVDGVRSHDRFSRALGAATLAQPRLHLAHVESDQSHDEHAVAAQVVLGELAQRPGLARRPRARPSGTFRGPARNSYVVLSRPDQFGSQDDDKESRANGGRPRGGRAIRRGRRTSDVVVEKTVATVAMSSGTFPKLGRADCGGTSAGLARRRVHDSDLLPDVLDVAGPVEGAEQPAQEVDGRGAGEEDEPEPEEHEDLLVE